ncbi:carboxypeptidase-like regulatory domain-containing protein [Geodermatophilus nigrescens]
MDDWRLTGRVVDRDGRPVEEATVAIVDGPGEWADLAVVTAADGAFGFSSLSEGTFRLSALSPRGGRGEGWFRSSRSPSEDGVLVVTT